MIVGLILSFIVGIAASLAASWLLVTRDHARYRTSFHAILRLVSELAAKLKSDGFVPDFVVTIDRNASVVGAILSGHLGLRANVALSTINLRLADGSRSISMDPLSQATVAQLEGKNVLLLICCNDSGTSLGFVYRKLVELAPDQANRIRTSAVFSSYSPGFMPNYVGATVGVDTRHTMDQVISSLPWMTRDWIHVFGDERRRRS